MKRSREHDRLPKRVRRHLQIPDAIAGQAFEARFAAPPMLVLPRETEALLRADALSLPGAF